MWNKIRFGTQAIIAEIFKKDIPLCVGIHVTSRCNFKCIYCYGGFTENGAQEFTFGEIIHLIDELKALGTLWVTLTGGEPLLRADIGVIIDLIKKKGMICSMNTNGSLIPKKIDAIRKIDFITVSLDGDKRVNDLNRGSGSFERIMDGINCLKSNKITFDVVCVLTRHNMDNMDTLLALAEKSGFYIEFNFLEDQNVVSQDHSPFDINDEDMRRITKKIIEYKNKKRPIFYAASSRRYVLHWPLGYREKILFSDVPGFKPIPCFMGKRMCHIDYDGKVYPCNQLIGKFPALNFLESGFKKAWENLSHKRTCKACYAVCFAEFNRFFGLKMDVWLNNAMFILKRRTCMRR